MSFTSTRLLPGSGRGLGSGGGSQGAVGIGVRSEGRAVWAMDVLHSTLAEEVLGLGSSGDSRGVVGTEVHREGRAVWAVDVPHSVLAEEVPRVAISVVLESALKRSNIAPICLGMLGGGSGRGLGSGGDSQGVDGTEVYREGRAV